MKLTRTAVVLVAIFLTLFTNSVQTRAAQPPSPADQPGAEALRYIADGQYKLGVIKAREVLAKAEQAGNPNSILLVNPLFYLAELLGRTGQWAEAKGLFERAIEIIERDRGAGHLDLGETLIDYAKLLVDMGDLAAAQSAASRAQEILDKSLHPNDLRIAAALTQLGRLALLKSDPGAAKPLFERALKIRQSQSRPRPAQVAVALQLLGIAHQRLSEPLAARKYFQQALQIRERALGTEHPALAGNLTRLAMVSERTQDIAAAKSLYERALSIARKSAIPNEQLRAAAGLAQLNERQNRPVEATELYRESIRVLESLSGQFEDESARERYLQAGDKWQIYDALARLLLQLHEQDRTKGYDREAWAVIEAKRNRVVSEVIAASAPKQQDPQVRERIDKVHDAKSETIALEKALAEEQARPADAQQPSRLENLTTLLAQTKSEYLKQVQTFIAAYPQYRTQFVDQQTIDPKALAKFADRLPANTLAVQLFASADALYIFAVAPGGYFQVKRQAVTQKDLYTLIAGYRDYLERGASERLSWSDDGSPGYRRDTLPFKELTERLSTHLLGPIEAELKANRNVILIPNDMLLYLPIHALTQKQSDGSKRFLAETHTVSYLTQLELADIVNPGGPKLNVPLLALANPDGTLPAASREVREIGKLRSGVTTLDGLQATKERFLSLAGNFPDLHLATHGVLDPVRPEKSYLLMAGKDEESQRLSIAEIAGMRLSPNGLAILSACETAVGEQVPGAALITLSAAFSQAGSQSIMASLWKVADVATRDLMIALHGALPKVGRAAALQQAQLAVLKNPQTAHPFYWAPFILIGAR